MDNEVKKRDASIFNSIMKNRSVPFFFFYFEMRGNLLC